MDKLLKELTSLYSSSGEEYSIRDFVRKEFEKYSSEVYEDNIGNIFAKIGKGKPYYLISAHMDEISLMISSINENGKIRFIALGSINPLHLLKEKVVIITKRKEIEGKIRLDKKFLKEEKEKIRIKDLFVDIKTSSKKGVEKKGIRIGQKIFFKKSFSMDKKGIITSKSLDNRAGVYVLINILKTLKKSRFKGTVYLVGTVQEEIESVGARAVSMNIKPDIAISIDATPSSSQFNSEKIYLGKGPVVILTESNEKEVVFISDKNITNWLIMNARKEKIPVQILATSNATDSYSLSSNGTPTISIGVPCSNIHSSHETMSMKDIKNCIKLTSKAIINGPPY